MVNSARQATVRRVDAVLAAVHRRIGEDLLFAKLGSLLPPKHLKMADEYHHSRREAPPDSDEDDGDHSVVIMDECKEDVSEHKTEIIFEEGDFDDDDEDGPTTFAPWIKIKHLDQSFLISTMVDKEVARTSDLFRILEEERLDIMFENQCRTRTKVSHTIQARVNKAGYDMEALEKKLNVWALGKSMSCDRD